MPVFPLRAPACSQTDTPLPRFQPPVPLMADLEILACCGDPYDPNSRYKVRCIPHRRRLTIVRRLCGSTSEWQTRARRSSYQGMKRLLCPLQALSKFTPLLRRNNVKMIPPRQPMYASNQLPHRKIRVCSLALFSEYD